MTRLHPSRSRVPASCVSIFSESATIYCLASMRCSSCSEMLELVYKSLFEFRLPIPLPS